MLYCSYVEIYNDCIYDLLAPQHLISNTLNLAEDSKQNFFIKNVTKESVSSIQEVLSKLKKGEINRHYAKTIMNHTSSRSHTIFQFQVKSFTSEAIRKLRQEKVKSNINNEYLLEHVTKQNSFNTESELNFVDLAGSERVQQHSLLELVEGKSIANERINESKHINKSLFFLTRVISMKSDERNKNLHIPYRNSPLTKILRNSLGGNSKTLIFICINPSINEIDQSFSTMRFGSSAKLIQNNIQRNINFNNDDEAIKLILNEYENRINVLKFIRIKKSIDNKNNRKIFRQIYKINICQIIQKNQKNKQKNQKKICSI